MIRPRWMKVLRDLWGNKGRTTLVVLSIAVGIFAVGTISGTQQLLNRELSQAWVATHPPHATLYTDLFDDELVEVVRSIDGVAEAEGRRSASLQVQVGADEWETLDLTVIPDFNAMHVSKIDPERGAFPPGRNEVLIERASLSMVKAEVGESLVVESSDRKLRELKVSGVVHDISQFPTALSGTAYGYIIPESMERLAIPPGYNRLQIRLAQEMPDPEEVRRVADLVKEKVEKSGRLVRFTDIAEPGKHPVDDVLQTFMLILGVLGSISLLASGFLVINTIGAILAQNVRQIGIMKAVGARTSQIIGLYFGLVLAYGLLSLLVGIPLGALGAWGFSTWMAGMINFDLADPWISSSVLLLEAAVGLLVPLLSAIVPVIAGARVTVREAISDHGSGSGPVRRGLIDRLLEQIQFLSRPFLLSLRNTFRRKGRLALTLITLTLGGAIFIGVFSVRASLMRTLDDALQYWNYDVDVDMQRPYRNQEMERVALQVPGVVKVESWGFANASRKRADGTDGPTLFMVAPPAETEMLKPTLLSGRWLLPDDENALLLNTDALEKESDIQVGDWISLTINGKESSWQVVGTVQGIMTGPAVYANYPYYSNLVQRPGRSSGIRVVTEQHDPAFQAQVAKALKARLNEAGLRVSRVDSMSSIREQTENQFNILVIFLAIMAVLLATVGGLGLAGTMSINVLERTREIGVMRAIGASTGAMLRIFMAEGALIALISMALSTLAAWPLSRLLSDAVGLAFMKAPLSYTFSVTGVLLWLVVATVIALVSSLLPSWRAARITVRDVLAYE